MPRRTRRTTEKGRKLNKRQIRQVKRVVALSSEVKEADAHAAGLSVTSAPVIVQLGAPTQGDSGTDQRIGNVIQVKSLKVKFSIIAADATNFVRIILFRWHQDGGTIAPTTGDVLQSTVLSPWLSPYDENVEHANLVHVIYDRCFALTLAGNGCVAASVTRFGKKLGRKKIVFTSDAVATGTNQIYMLYVSDSVAATHPTLNYYSRVDFMDD